MNEYRTHTCGELNENNIMPEAFDPRVADVVSKAVMDHIEK